MEKSSSRRNRPSSPPLQMDITFAAKDRILDARTRSEVVALLARLLLQTARRSIEGEVRDDAS